jgi:hypothetical protein
MSVSRSIPRSVGANFVAGVAYLGAAEVPNVLLLNDDASRLQPSLILPQSEALREYANRLKEEFRRLRPMIVCAVYPRLHSNWAYKDAFKRVVLEAGMMIAAAEEGIEFRQVKQQDIAKFTLAPVATFPEAYAKRIGLEKKPLYWTQRSIAFGAAEFLLQEFAG